MVSEPLPNTTIYTGLDNNDLIIVSRQPLAQPSSIYILLIWFAQSLVNLSNWIYIPCEVYAKKALRLILSDAILPSSK